MQTQKEKEGLGGLIICNDARLTDGSYQSRMYQTSCFNITLQTFLRQMFGKPHFTKKDLKILRQVPRLPSVYWHHHTWQDLPGFSFPLFACWKAVKNWKWGLDKHSTLCHTAKPACVTYQLVLLAQCTYTWISKRRAALVSVNYYVGGIKSTCSLAPRLLCWGMRAWEWG